MIWTGPRKNTKLYRGFVYINRAISPDFTHRNHCRFNLRLLIQIQSLLETIRSQLIKTGTEKYARKFWGISVHNVDCISLFEAIHWTNFNGLKASNWKPIRNPWRTQWCSLMQLTENFLFGEPTTCEANNRNTPERRTNKPNWLSESLEVNAF